MNHIVDFFYDMAVRQRDQSAGYPVIDNPPQARVGYNFGAIGLPPV